MPFGDWTNSTVDSNRLPQINARKVDQSWQQSFQGNSTPRVDIDIGTQIQPSDNWVPTYQMEFVTPQCGSYALQNASHLVCTNVTVVVECQFVGTTTTPVAVVCGFDQLRIFSVEQISAKRFKLELK